MIHYSKYGEGDVIVLLHGFCENSTCFSKQVFFLQQFFCVITPDLPGFGNSTPLENTTMESLADEVFNILQHEKISSCMMFGHSMGGYVTLAFAEKYSSVLNGFGLIHSTAYADTDERKQKRDQAIHIIEEKGVDFYVEQFIPSLFCSFHDEKILDKLIKEGKRSTKKGLTEAIFAMKARTDSTLLLKIINIPVLFVVGKNDSIIPEKDMFYHASLCEQSEIIYLEHSAHMGYIEESEKCSAVLQRFALENRTRR